MAMNDPDGTAGWAKFGIAASAILAIVAYFFMDRTPAAEAIFITAIMILTVAAIAK